jgi:hypothetical protein
VLILAGLISCGGTANAERHGHDMLVVTSTNDASRNSVAVFRLDTDSTPSLTLAQLLPTGGKGGAGGNAGSVQFRDGLGAVANFGSNSVTQLFQIDGRIVAGRTIHLADDCTGPDSVALTEDHLFVAGATCAESHAWPSGHLDGSVVTLSDNSAGQIAVGETWAAVTMKSGTVEALGMEHGALSGAVSSIALPAGANDTPLGAAFWGNVLGFTPAHSPNSFALIDAQQDVFPIAGPTPPYPTNAPCWVAKGPNSAWYAGNSPGQAVSIFLTDGQGGTFYKSIPLGGVATDITVSRDQNWLAVIYTAGDGAHVKVFSIDAYGDLKLAATSPAIGVTSFNGVSFSQ